MVSGMIRFGIQLTFELLICSGAVLFPRDEPTLFDIEEKTSFEQFLIIYSIVIAIFTFAFIVLTLVVTCLCSRRAVQQSQRIRKLQY